MQRFLLDGSLFQGLPVTCLQPLAGRELGCWFPHAFLTDTSPSPGGHLQAPEEDREGQETGREDQQRRRYPKRGDQRVQGEGVCRSLEFFHRPWRSGSPDGLDCTLFSRL